MADFVVSMCEPSAWTPGTTGGGERGASYRQFVDNRGNNTGRIHTEEPFYLRGADSFALEIESGFMVSMWFFDVDLLSIGTSLGNWVTGGTYAVPDSAVYAAVLYARQSGAIAPSDVADHPFYVTLSGGGGSMISDAIQLFDYDDSYVGWVTFSAGDVDPHTTYAQGGNNERYGGVRDAQPGQVFELRMEATPTAGGALWVSAAFYDADMRQLSRSAWYAPTDATSIMRSVTAPAGTAYMRPSARFFSDGFLSVETEADPDESAWGGGRYER